MHSHWLPPLLISVFPRFTAHGVCIVHLFSFLVLFRAGSSQQSPDRNSQPERTVEFGKLVERKPMGKLYLVHSQFAIPNIDDVFISSATAAQRTRSNRWAWECRWMHLCLSGFYFCAWLARFAFHIEICLLNADANYRSQLILYLFTIFLPLFPSFIFVRQVYKFNSQSLCMHECRVLLALCYIRLFLFRFGFFFCLPLSALRKLLLFLIERTRNFLKKIEWIVLFRWLCTCVTQHKTYVCYGSQSVSTENRRKKKTRNPLKIQNLFRKHMGTNFYVVQSGILGDEKKGISLSLSLSWREKREKETFEIVIILLFSFMHSLASDDATRGDEERVRVKDTTWEN